MYKKISEVYSGPFSEVYKGVDGDGAVVALKVVDLDFVKPPHDFRREVGFMKRLKHAHVAEFLDTYAMGEDHYLVMPFYEHTLSSVMNQYMTKKIKYNLNNPALNAFHYRNQMPVDILNSIVWGLIDGLKYIHAKQIIHRDIKPSNIFFANSNALDKPIIGDFGISYDLAHPPLNESQDEKFTDIATGFYKAPELCFGIGSYGTEVDLWSLGILISYLYSNDGQPANHVAYDDDNEQFPQLNDFVLIQGTFQAFGTPTVTDPGSPLYWPILGKDGCHFSKFDYKKYDRKPAFSLLPRCDDERIHRVFARLTRYDGRTIEEE